ncbi:MAG: sigma-54 dependent transcriptional regulator [Nitrospinota bacterium]
MGTTKVLLYEKSSHRTEGLRQILEEAGYRVRAAFYPSEAEKAAQNDSFDVLIAGFDNFPLPQSLEKITTIILAPDGRYQEVDAIARRKSPPLTCITYPLEKETALRQIKGVLQKKERAVGVPREQPEKLMPEIIGRSDAMQKVFQTIALAAKFPSTVLILGETGTGKELAAHALHRLGGRAERPFIAINCAAIPESLLESELFGYEKGAFTGADRRRAGMFEAAHGGTLFLDEIGEMPQSLQAKLLRVLETKNFYRLGGTDLVQVDTRVICATNRDVLELAGHGGFRRDLLYRINVVSVTMPPLRERVEDIMPLAEHFLRQYSKLHNSPAKKFSARVIEKMKMNPWPGNARQLKNSVERSAIQCRGKTVEEIDSGAVPGPVGRGLDIKGLVGMDFGEMKEHVLAHYELEYIRALLKQGGGSIQSVCAQSGMDRKTLYRKMKQYGLDKKDFK